MKDWDEIDVNERSGDKIYFESPLVQSIADSIGFMKEESKEILNGIDSTEFIQKIDEFDFEDLGDKTVTQITNIVDDLSELKDNVMESDEVPEFVKESSKEFKSALNRDSDYVRRAKRRLLAEDYDNDERIVRLCDKAIELNNLNWEAYYIKGIALINLDEYDEAIDQLISSLALNEDNINARLYVANAYRLKSEFESAIEAYDSVLKIDEDSFDAFKGKAFTYYNWNKFDKANEFFLKANSIQHLDEKSKEIWDVCLDNL